MEKKAYVHRMSRRRFLTWASMASAGISSALCLGACTPPPTATPVPPTPTGEEEKAEAPAPTEPAPEFPEKMRYATVFRFSEDSGWNAVLDAFSEQHGGVEFEETAVPSAEFITKMLAEYAGGKVSDFHRIRGFNEMAPFIVKGALADLTPYMEGDPDFDINDFYAPQAEQYLWKGKYYAIPEDLQPCSPMFYNKKIFDEAGLEPPTNDWDWDRLLEVAQKLTQKDAEGRTTQYGYHYMGWTWPMWMWQNGGDFADKVEDPTKCTLDDPKAVEGVEFAADLAYEYEMVPTRDTVSEMGMADAEIFATGRVAMYTAGTWVTNTFIEYGEDLDWGMVYTPKWHDGTRAYATGGSGWGIPANAEHPDASWEVIKYIFSEEGLDLWVKNRPADLVWLFVRKSIAEKQAEALEEFVENAHIIPDSAQYAHRPPKHLGWEEINSKVIDPEIDLILRGKKPVEATLQEVAKNATKMLQEWEA